MQKDGVAPNSAPLWRTIMASAPSGLKEVYAKIRKRAIKQAAEAYATNERKRAKNPQHHYKIGFRSYKRTRTEVIILEKGYPFKKKTPRKPKPPKPGAKPRKTKPRKPASEFQPDMGPVHKIRLSPSPLWGNGKKCAGDVFFGGTLTATGPVRIADRTEVIEQLAADGYLKEDAQILWDKTVGSFHMLVRMRRTKPADSDPEGRRKTVVSLDPGCRSFNVYYDRTGRHGELLSGAEEGINARCKRIDGLCAQHSKLAKAKHLTRQVRRRRKRRVRKTLARERKSMRNWMRNAHYDASNFLLSRYDVVLAPTFAVKDMAKRNTRVFGSKTARAMYNWSHYSFRQRLKSKAFSYAGRSVIEIGEPGTSKTCGCCGSWKADLGGNHIYECSKCNITIDRDVNGARNNMLAAYGRATGEPWDGTE